MLRILLLAAVAGGFPACGGAPVAENNAVNEPAPVVQEQPKETQTSENDCRICEFDHAAYKGPLSKEEIDGLLLALNDEYLAWATYDRVNKDFNDPRPFVNIQQAEGRHIERLKGVFDSYEVPFPENKWLGSAPQFKSLQEACKAGVDGEIANRDLYTRLFKTTKREDITLVYKALQSASEENHLPAFQRCLDSGGGNGRGKGYGRGANRGS